MGLKNYTLSVDDRAGVPMGDLVRRLREAGFEVTQPLDAIGVILGRADEAEIPRLRGIRGVSAIEEERTVKPLR